MKKQICVLSGAGISAESGLKTFRDSDGLWEGYDVHEVATPEAWERDPELVLKFYNERRKQVREAEPNAAHRALVELEADFDVQIITQNIDDLHERAGSSNVLHLHGEVLKSKTNQNPYCFYDVPGDIELGDTDEHGNQLRPHVVWFGEAVPAMEEAAPLVAESDILIIVGTSLVVYPAASLVGFCRPDCSMYLIDPNESTMDSLGSDRVTFLIGTAVENVPKLKELLLAIGD